MGSDQVNLQIFCHKISKNSLFLYLNTPFGHPKDPSKKLSFRFISIGRSEVGQLLVVAYTKRDNHIRIITAWRAMPQEVRNYEPGSKHDSGR